jgi:hypothetical protein
MKRLVILSILPAFFCSGITISSQLNDHMHSTYHGSDKYVQGVFLGNERDYANPAFRDFGYTVKGNQLFNSTNEAVYGVTVPYQKSVFGGVKSFITISPNMVSYTNNLHTVLGHEVIHAFHFYTGFMARYGIGASEYYAHRFSASVPHVSQAGAASVADRLWIGLPLPHQIVYPSWVPKFIY